MRDLRSIYAKLLQVLYPPKGGSQQALRDWDLWGPLVICLSLAITLSLDVSCSLLGGTDTQSPKEQSMQVFSLVISLVTIGSVVVTINSKLLGGKVSFFQSLCVLGYALAPLLLASIVALLLHNLFVRVPVSLICFGWSVWGKCSFMGPRRELTRSVDELLQWNRPPRLADTAGSVPAVPVLLRPVLDDHDPVIQ